MNTQQIASYTRNILDDPNVVFMPNSLLATFLDLAYYEFRQKVPQEVYEQYYQPAALSAQTTVDLQNILFGPVPTNLAQRLTRVIVIDPSSGNLLNILKPASSFESLAPVISSGAGALVGYGARWWLDGRILRFSIPITGTVQIWYLPDPQIDWLAGISAPTYVDDISQFHDIIALLASQHYYIKDGSSNPKLDQRLGMRLNEMQEFFAQTRSGQGSRYVQDDEEWGWGG